MLSFWVSPQNQEGRSLNTTWLVLAIQHAKDAGAHRYASVPASYSARRNGQLKRLWWCCIIRDRILSLGLRRELQITRSTFDFDSSPALDVHDLSGETHQSRVYDAETKTTLIQLAAYFFRLCVILTDLLSLTPQPEDGRVLNTELQGDRGAQLIQKLKLDLAAWYTGARRLMPASEVFLGDSQSPCAKQRTVYLHTHTLRLYY